MLAIIATGVYSGHPSDRGIFFDFFFGSRFGILPSVYMLWRRLSVNTDSRDSERIEYTSQVFLERSMSISSSYSGDLASECVAY